MYKSISQTTNVSKEPTAEICKMKKHNDLQELYEAARSGRKVDEEQLFSYLRVRFSAIAKHRIQEDFAEDIAHDACVTVLEKYKDLTSDVLFESWAYQVLRNKIGSFLRDSKVRKVVQFVEQIESYGHEQTYSDRVELKQALVNCLKKLNGFNPKYIRIIQLINQGYKTKEICDKLSITPNNLYVLLYRCRKLLYDCIYTAKEEK